MVKKYFTHFNGARVFMVEDYQNYVKVFFNSVMYGYEETPKTFDEEVFSSEYNHIWIGEHPHLYWDKKEKIYNTPKKESKGNSVLIKKDNTYTFIGDRIFSFKPKEKILEFYSPIGRNNVPYPFAVSEKNIYLLGYAYLYFPLEGFCKVPEPDPHRYFESYDLSIDDVKKMNIKKIFEPRW